MDFEGVADVALGEDDFKIVLDRLDEEDDFELLVVPVADGDLEVVEVDDDFVLVMKLDEESDTLLNETDEMVDDFDVL